MTIPAQPDRWDLRVESDGRLVLVAKNHEHDTWRDVATFRQGDSLAQLIRDRLNGR